MLLGNLTQAGGGNGSGSGGGGTTTVTGARPAVQVWDTSTTTLPSGASYTFDGYTVVNNDRVLFTALSSGTNNAVYKVSGVGSSLSWTLQTDGQSGTGVVSAGDFLSVTSSHTQQFNTIIYFPGTGWNEIAYVWNSGQPLLQISGGVITIYNPHFSAVNSYAFLTGNIFNTQNGALPCWYRFASKGSVTSTGSAAFTPALNTSAVGPYNNSRCIKVQATITGTMTSGVADTNYLIGDYFQYFYKGAGGAYTAIGLVQTVGTPYSAGNANLWTVVFTNPTTVTVTPVGVGGADTIVWQVVGEIIQSEA